MDAAHVVGDDRRSEIAGTHINRTVRHESTAGHDHLFALHRHLQRPSGTAVAGTLGSNGERVHRRPPDGCAYKCSGDTTQQCTEGTPRSGVANMHPTILELQIT